MGPVLVVGATGQLGTAVVDRIAGSGGRVRAFVRPATPREFSANGVELAFGDLREPESLRAACAGIATVVATANAVVPRGKADFDAVEGAGYDNLIAACREQGVRRIVFVSVPETAYDRSVTTFRLKRAIEEKIRGSGVPHFIFRCSLFMDDWFALMGSSIPLRGAPAATLRRPFWFSKAFLAMVGTSIERRGIALVPGSGKTRHAFVALDDIASILTTAAAAPADDASFIEELGGPEVLSWNDVVAIFAKVLGRPIRSIRTPAKVYRVLADLLEPFSPQAGNLMAMSWVGADCGSEFDGKPLADRFGVRLTSAEAFLRAKAALPPEA